MLPSGAFAGRWHHPAACFSCAHPPDDHQAARIRPPIGLGSSRRFVPKNDLRERFCYPAVMTDSKSQTDKFKEAARELECEDDEQRFQERVKKLVRHKPVEKPGE